MIYDKTTVDAMMGQLNKAKNEAVLQARKMSKASPEAFVKIGEFYFKASVAHDAFNIFQAKVCKLLKSMAKEFEENSGYAPDRTEMDQASKDLDKVLKTKFPKTYAKYDNEFAATIAADILKGVPDGNKPRAQK